MNTAVSEALAAQRAEFERIVDAPSGALAYGSDLSCVTDCDARFTELAIGSPRIVAQAVARRFQTPRGGVLDAPDYGFDLRPMCNRGTSEEDLRALHSRMHAEATKDERVDSASIALEIERGGTAVAVVARVELTLRASGEAFRFVLTATSAEVLLQLEGE